MIHVDLDGASTIFAVHGLAYPAETDPLFETGLRNCLDFLADAGLKATFFVIAGDLRYPAKRALIQEAVRAGHEIASHSLSHPKLTTLPEEARRREVFESRAVLAETLGTEVTGFRAPMFDVDRPLFELLGEAGYRYDSSLFPRADVARRIGVPRLERQPHHPIPGGSLLELPLPAYAPLPFPFHPSYSLMLGTWYYRLGMARFTRYGAPLVLLFHLTDFADPLPPGYVSSSKIKYFTLSHLPGATKIKRCRQMVSHTQRYYQVIPTQQYIAQYALPSN